MRYVAGSVALMTPNIAFAIDSVDLSLPGQVPFVFNVLFYGAITYGIVSYKLKKWM